MAPAPREHGTPPPPQEGLLGAPALPELPPVITPFEVPVAETMAEVAARLALKTLEAAVPVGLILALVFGTITPAQAPGLPHPPLLPINPDELRLRELAAKHAAGTLTAEEEAELIALLAKIRGLHIRSLNDLYVEGSYKGQPVGLPGFHYEKITYTKRDPAVTAALRRKFNPVREAFLKKISAEQATVAALRTAGFDDDALNLMRNGEVPAGYQVHHQLPLDDSGDNSFDNLVLIKQTPYHSVITTHQLRVTGKLKPGQTDTVQWPFYRGGIVYPPRKL